MYSIYQLSNRFAGSLACKHGLPLKGNYQTLAEARKALAKERKSIVQEYEQYDYPYNVVPFEYYIVYSTGETVE